MSDSKHGSENRAHEEAAGITSKQFYHNDSLETRNIVFGVILGLLQITFCIIYGFLYNVKAQVINMTSIITAIALAILIIPGFGLLFGYTKKLVWSGMGFNLFIVAFCLEFYPLINNFWTRTQIQRNNNPLLDFSYSNRYYDLYLANRDTLPTAGYTGYGNCITNALKCGLAMAIAFSAILGRAGQLECLLVCIVGTIGYELNRQLLQERIGSDSFETFIIFTYGGFMALALGLFAYLREQKEQNSMEHRSLKKYTCSSESALNSVLGALIIFVFFPFLAYEVDAYIYQNTFIAYTATASIVLAMGAGLCGGMIFSMIFHGYIVLRDVTHGAIAGAIATGAASLYILNPAWAIITGFIAGILQGLFQNFVQKKSAISGSIVSTVSWILFGANGFLGGLFAAAWKDQAKRNHSSSFSTFVLQNNGEQNQVYIMLISIGMGLGFGLIAGLLTYITNPMRRKEYFEDGYFWRMPDGIRTVFAKMAPRPVRGPAVVQEEEIELEFEEPQEEEVKNQHAYL